jgi:hypothetical protein
LTIAWVVDAVATQSPSQTSSYSMCIEAPRTQSNQVTISIESSNPVDRW